MFDENAFSLDAFDNDSWLFMLDAPYFSLSGKLRVYVRTVLDSVYSHTEVEQIISTAAQHNLSIFDAATAIHVSTDPLQVIVRDERKAKAEPRVREPKTIQPTPERKNLPAYALTEENRVFTRADVTAIFAFTQAQSLVASTGGSTIFTKE